MEWSSFMQGLLSKAADYKIARDVAKAQPAPVINQQPANKSPGNDGQPVKPAIDGKWLVGGALALGAVLLIVALKKA